MGPDRRSLAGALLLAASLLPLRGEQAVPTQPDATAIMARVAANMEGSVPARRLYLYHQRVKARLLRTNGKVAREESRHYLAVPGARRTEKKLLSFQGRYAKDGSLIAYDKPGFTYKETDIDGELIDDLTNDLVNDRGSRDGIPLGLFPFLAKDLPLYRFTWKGTREANSREAYSIAFEPRPQPSCDHRGDDAECRSVVWKGDLLVDAEESFPVFVQTQLAVKVPFVVRTFLGTNLKQTGFSVTFNRVAPNVWFPVSYGTEFRVSAVFFYKRVITLSLQSGGFQKTEASSNIRYLDEVDQSTP